MKTKLTKQSVAALALPEGKADEIHWDAALDRFGLRLRRSGGRVVRTWTIQYRHGGGTRRLAIGSAETLSPEQAREAARQRLAQVDLGHDPAGAKADRRDKDKLSFKAVVAQYIEARRGELRPATMQHTAAYLTRPQYFKPLWGMPIDQITRRDVAALLLAIAGQSGRPTAKCARSVLSAFYVWSMQHGLCEQNPVIGSPVPKANPARGRVLSDSELAAIWKAADRNDDFSRIVRLLILLPCRRQEVGGIEWGEIDFEAETWTVPASRSKNGRSITYPLVPMALDIIKSVPRRLERDQLFGERRADGFCSWHKCKRLFDRRTGISAPFNLHDVRRSVATRMADLGAQPHIIEQVLNHQSGHRAGVSGIYNRSVYSREVKQALAMWADHVNALVTGDARKVVALHEVG